MRDYKYVPEGSTVKFSVGLVFITFPADKRKFPESEYDYKITFDGHVFFPDGRHVDDRHKNLKKELREFAELKRKKFDFESVIDFEKGGVKAIKVITTGKKRNTMATIFLEGNDITIQVIDIESISHKTKIRLPIDSRVEKSFGLGKDEEKGE